MATLIDYRGRLLNHLEMLHQPGERALAIKAYEALGCRVSQPEKPTMVAHVAPDSDDKSNNILYSSEVSPEQWEFEQTFKRALERDPELSGRAFARYDDKYRNRPHGLTHFGIRYPSFARLEATLTELETNLDPALRGRLRVAQDLLADRRRPAHRPAHSGVRGDRHHRGGPLLPRPAHRAAGAAAGTGGLRGSLRTLAGRGHRTLSGVPRPARVLKLPEQNLSGFEALNLAGPEPEGIAEHFAGVLPEGRRGQAGRPGCVRESPGRAERYEPAEVGMLDLRVHSGTLDGDPRSR